ncbi:hypothetical protein [Clostridium gasigenes]|uniref:hypothetical protein n=1 Tax=Clostridium gasigenes TaxID=94869 RepID=UPI001C0B07F2|nr:hypothetical protein [Clostridium gasigenes]MBU3105141.1 hypothetical protein [Clostridium gasigenes]
MANLDYTTLRAIEELFEMDSGYVLDFSNTSFARFVKGVIGIDIYYDKGYDVYCSKANKLRQIFENESNIKVSRLVSSLLSYCEDYKLKNDKLTEYDKKKIDVIKKDIEDFKIEDDEGISPVEELDKLIQKISTRNAQFSEMALDEKLKEIGNVIENLLKDGKKFITLDYNDISLGFIEEVDVKGLRKKVQCFRHSSKDSIDERKTYTEKQKQFMVEFGVVISNLIFNELK